MLERACSSRRGGGLGLSSLSLAPPVQHPPTATDVDCNTDNTAAAKHKDDADVSEDVRRKDEDVNRRSSLGFRSNFAATRGGSSALLASRRLAAGAGQGRQMIWRGPGRAPRQHRLAVGQHADQY